MHKIKINVNYRFADEFGTQSLERRVLMNSSFLGGEDRGIDEIYHPTICMCCYQNNKLDIYKQKPEQSRNVEQTSDDFLGSVPSLLLVGYQFVGPLVLVLPNHILSTVLVPSRYIGQPLCQLCTLPPCLTVRVHLVILFSILLELLP